ncbi:hypothetical protein F5Y05DRAFT_422076 [Hypoxylon sp. FL0543]|nr:hypothetical protein F5Y05DRAFT_422076 [Hypoxylon sp. FL0543]
MPNVWKNILYMPQKLKVEKHLNRGFGAHSDLVKETTYEEDEDDGTPCILITFWSIRAFSYLSELEAVRHGIENDQGSGLDKFRIDSMKMDQESLRRKNDELAQAYKEKNRKLLQIQELYDKLKRKAMLGQIQDAAEDAIDSTLHGGQSMGETQFEGGSQNPLNYEDVVSPYGHHSSALHEQQRIPVGSQQHAARQSYGTSWPRTVGAQSNVPITPSTHRQRLGDTNAIGLSAIPGVVAGTPRMQQTRSMPFSQDELSSSSFQSNTRYPTVGLSSGLRAGHGGGNPDSGSKTDTSFFNVQPKTDGWAARDNTWRNSKQLHRKSLNLFEQRLRKNAIRAQIKGNRAPS